MKIIKTLDAEKGIVMIEKMLEENKGKLPEGKTIKDFGGGYVECLKSKAKVVLYFGFDGSNNRVSIKFQVNRDEVLLWLEAIGEKLWNKEKASDEIVSFSLDETVKTDIQLQSQEDSFFKETDSPF